MVSYRDIGSAFNPIKCGPNHQTYRVNLQAAVKLEASYLGVVGGLLDDLGSHPERRPHKRLPLDLRVRQLTSHAKVSQLHLAMLRQQHVGSLRELLLVCQIIVTISFNKDLNNKGKIETRSMNIIHSDVCLLHEDTVFCILMYDAYHCWPLFGTQSGPSRNFQIF